MLNLTTFVNPFSRILPTVLRLNPLFSCFTANFRGFSPRIGVHGVLLAHYAPGLPTNLQEELVCLDKMILKEPMIAPRGQDICIWVVWESCRSGAMAPTSAQRTGMSTASIPMTPLRTPEHLIVRSGDMRSSVPRPCDRQERPCHASVWPAWMTNSRSPAPWRCRIHGAFRLARPPWRVQKCAWPRPLRTGSAPLHASLLQLRSRVVAHHAREERHAKASRSGTGAIITIFRNRCPDHLAGYFRRAGQAPFLDPA